MGLALLVSARVCAGQASLAPGAHASDCASALRIGIVSCRATRNGAARADPTEARVEAFLQQYGKPPREAVRALLDPTDENIAAWLRVQRRTVSIAAYVAGRMTELQGHLDRGGPLPVAGSAEKQPSSGPPSPAAGDDAK